MITPTTLASQTGCHNPRPEGVLSVGAREESQNSQRLDLDFWGRQSYQSSLGDLPTL